MYYYYSVYYTMFLIDEARTLGLIRTCCLFVTVIGCEESGEVRVVANQLLSSSLIFQMYRPCP